MTNAAPRTQTLVMEGFPNPVQARALSPNGRAHWARKRDARDYVYEQVWFFVRLQPLAAMCDGFVTMWPTLTYPIKRKRDDDNAATGVLKAVRDALVKLKLLAADDTEHLRQMPVEVRVQKGRRALELRFEVAA